jgi:glycosyltransferase involved in cell wall biosynthesis
MRIAVVSERLRLPYDEGFKNSALQLAKHLSADHDVLGLTVFGADIPEYGIHNVPSNRLFASPTLAGKLRRFRPDLTYYIPTAAATPFSLLRARLLKWYGRGAPVALVALQPRHPGSMASRLMPLFPPDAILSPSQRVLDLLPSLRCPMGIIPLGVDLERFSPGDERTKRELRAKYGVHLDRPLLLHVGHIKRERNVDLLPELGAELGCQTMVVGSTSTDAEADLAGELRAAGVKVIAEYIDIVEAYRLADAYLFPVEGDMAAIGLPLSVMEAMACNLPVVSTPFGGLPSQLPESPQAGLWYAGSKAEFVELTRQALALREPTTRRLILPYGWPDVVRRIQQTAVELLRMA